MRTHSLHRYPFAHGTHTAPAALSTPTSAHRARHLFRQSMVTLTAATTPALAPAASEIASAVAAPPDHAISTPNTPAGHALPKRPAPNGAIVGHHTAAHHPLISSRVVRVVPHQRPAWHHNIVLASLQLIVGYQLWASGVDKLLFARFPQTVGSLLAGVLRGGTIPAPVADLLRAVVLPNSVPFGFLVEWGETLAGLGLIGGAVVALLAPSIQRRLARGPADLLAQARRVIAWLALGAAAGGAAMGLSFYFVDGAPSQWVMPSVAFGGVLDPGMLVLLGCLALLADAAYAWRLRHRS